MIKLIDALITDIMPAALCEDTNSHALAYAINKALAKVKEYSDSSMVYADMGKLSADVIEELSAELRTPYFDNDLDIDIKRNQIKDSLSWYAKAGTAGGIIEAMRSLYGDIEVTEWYEYDGDPYHFRIRVITDQYISDEERYSIANDRINYYKNVRSVLDSIEYVIKSVTAKQYAATFTASYSVKDSCQTLNTFDVATNN